VRPVVRSSSRGMTALIDSLLYRLRVAPHEPGEALIPRNPRFHVDEPAQLAHGSPPEAEQRDIHEADAAIEWALDQPPPAAPVGLRAATSPKVVRTLKIAAGMTSSVWDYGTPPNGGIIGLRACVHHIPVIRQTPGRGDLDVLERVLRQQGLMVQFGTDAEGNVARYTRANRLCYHARGGNQVTCGIEHMHYLTSEAWTERQMRAAGWVTQYLEREYGIPLQMANVEPAGSGVVSVVRKGHTSHRQISKLAGYNDRSDPGPGFDYDKVFALARYFKRHGHFVGA
jgi:hypothetical protein